MSGLNTGMRSTDDQNTNNREACIQGTSRSCISQQCISPQLPTSETFVVNSAVKPHESNLSNSLDRSNSSNLSALHEAVRMALVQLPFSAYLVLVRQVLTGSGYASVRSLGRGVSRQSLSIGGFDLLGFCHTDLTTGLTAIQIKQYSGTVARRFVDELRGAMLRLGAESGLLVVTGQFSQAARDAALATAAFPIRLVDGRKLASRLVERGEGICITALPKHPGQSVEWGVDLGYFAGLAEQVPITHPAKEKR